MILMNYEQKGMGTTDIYSPSLSNDQSDFRTIILFLGKPMKDI
jgi:hypothetical protein